MTSKTKHSIYKTSTILFLIGLFSYFFNIGFNALLARHVSHALFGDFSVALRVLNIASVCMLCGTLSSSKRFYSQYLKSNKMDSASKYINWNVRLVFISSLFVLAVLTLLIIVILCLHLQNIYDIRKYHLLIYFLWLAPINAITLLISSYLICDRDVYLGTFFDAIGFYAFGILLLIPFIYLFHIPFHALDLWFLMLCIFIFMMIAESLILFKRIPALLKNSFTSLFSRKSSDNVLEKQWWTVSKRLIINQMIYLFVRAADILLLAIMSSDKKIVGYYAAALTVSGIFFVTQTALFQSPSALFSSLVYDQSKKQQLQNLINKTNLMNIILNVALLILIFIFTNPILKLFGAAFIIAKIPLWILLGGTLISILTASAPRLLAYSGYEIYLVYIALAEIVIIIVLGVILIYFYGAIGAALAVVTTSLLRAFASVYLVRKKIGVKAALVI
ncbi:MAG TPA: hypothetical protein VJK30_02845 [Coxiellaceae bacterium]|nr:MAG: hypothetical protein A3E81_02845 [Gammaproteobacteria bacterium RIFCSPHIGHO2_12_FULL_36_30]HLB56253.1 hypothetical protein [Coxiellaceae bacterium]